jgi:hypothetical protein
VCVRGTLQRIGLLVTLGCRLGSLQ